MTEQLIQANAMDIVRLVEEGIKSGKGASSELLAKVAEGLARQFSAGVDEVAILHYDAKNVSLNFLVPERLRAIGSLPLTVTHSLAVRTFKDKRPEIVNNFVQQKHPTIFESIKSAPDFAEQHPIQKIMSAPLMTDSNAIGVVQISRKGKSHASAGPDFSIRDLTALIAVASSLAKLFKNAVPDVAQAAR